MAEEQKNSSAETVDAAASAAHTVKGAIKAGKAISGAAKGAAAAGPLWGCGWGRLGRPKAHRQNHCRHCHSAFAACPFPPDAARPDFWRAGQCLFTS